MKDKKEKAKGFIGEFKEFALRGNVMDLAVGVIIGAAFGAIVNSLVNDLIMPIISLVTGGINFNDWFVILTPGIEKNGMTLAAAQEAGYSVLSYGSFISAVVNFFIMAFCIFLMVKAVNKLMSVGKKEVEEEPTTKVCPFCKSEINIEATKCPHCASDIPEEVEEEGASDEAAE